MIRFIFKKTVIKTAIVVAVTTSSIQAQNGHRNPISTINPVSPTTAELLKYVDFNVSSSTGVPDITIPLFEMKGKQLSLPISISYNASGIKVNQQAGNIGLSWSLNAGGFISCAIRGKKDDASYWTNVPGPVNDGFDPGTSVVDFNLAKNIGNKVIDGAPDLYSYNFCNYSGKFLDIIGKPSPIVMIPKKPLLITSYATVPASVYKNFKVVSEDGTQYFFEKLERSTIRTSYGISETGFTNYLIKIRSADGSDEINFSYDTTYYEDLPALSESFTYLFNACNFGTDITSGSQPSDRFTSSSRIRGVQLKRITFSEGSVDFQISYDRQDAFGGNAVKNPKIDRIILKNLAGEELKTISFVYSYYNPTSTSLYMKRLRLDRVDICPQSGLCGNALYTNSYKFTYNAMALPALNSFAQDHWGYYNGMTGNTTFLPSYPVNVTPIYCYTSSPFCKCTTTPAKSFNGANKNSSPDHVKAGILEKIEYPTGGYTQFSFETNQTTPLNYLEPLEYVVGNQIFQNTAATGTEVSSSSGPSQVVPAGYSVCAKATVEYYTYSIPDATLKGKIPTAKIYKYDSNGAATLVHTMTLPYTQATTNYNFTMQPGYTYAVVFSTKVQGTTIKGSLNYSFPMQRTMPYYVGGLRLKQKTVYDPVSATSSVTGYTYSPAIFKNPTYTQSSYQFPGPTGGLCGEPCIGTGGNGTPPDYYDVKNYTTLIANNGGIDNEVNYVEITTIYGASGENGKTITRFSPVSNDYFWRRGSIDEQHEFNASGKLLRKVVNHYTAHPGSGEINRGLEVSATYAHPCLAGQPQNYSSYTKYAAFKPTFNPTEWFYQDTTTIYEYDTQSSNAKMTRAVFLYFNATHMQLSQQYMTNSVGKNIVSFFRYPIDYGYSGTLSGNALAMSEMNSKHIYNQPIEEVSLLVGGSPSTTLQTSAKLHTYKLNNGQIVKDAVYQLKYNANGGINQQSVSNYTYASIPNGQLVFDSRYELENQFTRYDVNQNPVELKRQDNTYAFRCPSNGDVWASVKHANYDETAYSSFEHGSVASDFTNWNYNSNNIFSDATPPPLRGTFNGSKCYKFSGSGDIISNRALLNASQRFKLSFWGKGGWVIVTGNGTVNFAPSAFNIPLRTGPVRMGWTYYEGYFTGASLVQLAGTGMIDELRLYPVSAQMETFVYKQGVGVWSKCNENNQNIFWDYDEFQRLRLVTDQDGYILNRNEYKYLHPQY